MIRIETFEKMDSPVVEIVAGLESAIFGEDRCIPAEVLLEESAGKKHLIILIAYMDEEACAFKVGYAYSPNTFYSWLGGVAVHARNQGVATKLMAEQHKLAKELGYRFVTTNTRNEFREMLILNLKAGFDIIGVQKRIGKTDQKILMEKEL